jgi:hypothetical protein
MPAIKRGNTYGTVLAAAVAAQNVAPASPDRIHLRIQNTGANPLTYQWGKNATGDVNKGEFQLAAGDTDVYDQNCPIESLSFFSLLGTMVTVYEGVSNG